MTATNHALTGAAIGFIAGNPWLAVPAALASHFLCDALPHFGYKTAGLERIKTDGFRNYLIVEAVACSSFVLLLMMLQPEHWLLAAACAFAAAAPDGLSFNRWYKLRHGYSWTPGRYSKFASGIQWFERPIGAVVEVAWFVAFGLIIVPMFLST